jgi:hypothetical protein
MKCHSTDPRNDVFKSSLVSGATFSKVYELPELKRSDFVPENPLPFDKRNTIRSLAGRWLHFYLFDRDVECLWNDASRYLGKFKAAGGVITPDYSLYCELPLPFQQWNNYRNRAIAYWLQKNGVPIIPNIRWGDDRSYPFAFEGFAVGGSMAVSTNGCIGEKRDRLLFQRGLEKMVGALHPDRIICYSSAPDDIFKE